MTLSSIRTAVLTVRSAWRDRRLRPDVAEQIDRAQVADGDFIGGRVEGDLGAEV